MATRSSGTMLPPVRRKPRRDWGRVIARVLCVMFAVAGLVPVGVGALVRTRWARDIATRETRKVLATFGVHATYDLRVRLWPLSLSLRNVRVQASDGGGPFLAAHSITARPRIFGLLAGKLVIDEVDVERPRARVVVRDGELQNLKLDLPESSASDSDRPPFDVVSASDLDLDLDLDGTHLVGKRIDLDVTTDVDDRGAPAFEVALRMKKGTSRIVRKLAPPEDAATDATDAATGAPSSATDYAVDEDTICRVDGRARIEKERVLIRRFEAFGAADLDPADGTSRGCKLPKTDKRYVELSLGHLDVGLPKREGDLPTVSGHVKARAPIALVGRLPDAPDADGWVSVDAEMRFTGERPIPDLEGTLEAHDVRVTHFRFARSIQSELEIRDGVVTSPLTRVEIADGVAELRGVEVQPLRKGIPLKADLEASSVDFTSLMRDLGVSDAPHVTWDLDHVKGGSLHGTINPLHIDGDLFAKTTGFAVYDRATVDPQKTRAIGVAQGDIRGKVAIRPTALEFNGVTVTTPKSVVRGVSVAIGFHEFLRVDVAEANVDLAELSPVGSVVMSGMAHAKASVSGGFSDPRVQGDASIDAFTIGDLSFGDVTQAHVALVGLAVDLRDVRAKKGESSYEMPTGRLDFGGAANMRMDGQITSKHLDVRDLLDVFKMSDDPRFAELGGVLETSARMHLALGGPEDVCHGGFLDLQATTTAHHLNLLGETFDEAQADFDYRWIDRQAGIDGAEIDVRSVALSKVKKPGKPAIGTVLGSLSVHRGGQLRGSLVMQGFPLARTDMLGSFAKDLEGTASGVARVDGTLDAYSVEADMNVTPVRVRGAPFGASNLHVLVTQTPKRPKVIGKTPCGAPITAPFDKAAYLADTSVKGAFVLDGSLFGGQLALDHVVVTRQVSPVLTGSVKIAGFDLAPIGRLLVASDDTSAPAQPPLGGEISGDLTIDRVAFGDLGHARVRFAPKVMRVSRGGQEVEWRPHPIVITLADDRVVLPELTFGLAAQRGLKGTIAVQGEIRRIMRGGELALDAELSPIDLGILVGIVPRMTRAAGTLSGSVRLTGKASQPQFDGRLEVRGGDFAIKGVPGSITGVEIDLVADENEARITRGVGKILGGDVALTARMPLRGGNFGIAEANLQGRHLYLSPMDGVEATFDTDLRVSVNPQASTPTGRLPFVGGDVTITSFEYTRPITLDLTNLRGGPKRTVVQAYDPSLDVVTLGVDVRSRVPLRIRNNLVEADLGIDPRGIHVSGTNQRLGLRGEMNTLPGGHFRVFANDFEIQKGAIRFDDPSRIAPHVDFTALTEYRRYTNTLATGGTTGSNTTGGAGTTAGNVSSGGGARGLWRITLHAYGDTEDLQVDMTSEPALSRSDIFFLLTIGLTRAEVDQVRAGSVYAGAAFEAIGTVSGVDRAVKKAIPVIDDFRPGTAYSPRTGRVEPNITVGRRLTDDLRATVTSGLAEDPQLRSTIEWRLNKTLTVEPSYDRIQSVSSSNVGNFGVDFRWRLEFD